MPVACSCSCAPLARDGLAGVMSMDTSVAGLTVNWVEPDTAPNVAVMVVVPRLTALARPVALMVAVESELELQVADADTSTLVPLLYRANALNWLVKPRGNAELTGSTLTEVTVGVAVVPVPLLRKLLDEVLYPHAEVRAMSPTSRNAPASRSASPTRGAHGRRAVGKMRASVKIETMYIY